MENLLLVEPAEAVSENVKEANVLRTDPLAATRLVSTPAQIKEKINSKMTPEGRYILNDQFSEATVTDINGNNLLNNEYYSFVSRDGDKLYMAKNNPETDVVEFSISDKKVVGNQVEEEVQPVQEEATVEENVTPVENVNEGFAKEDIDLGQEISIPVEEKKVTELSSMFSAPVEVSAEEVKKVTRELSPMFTETAKVEEPKAEKAVVSSLITNSDNKIGSENFDEIDEEASDSKINGDDVEAPIEDKEIEDNLDDSGSELERRLSELDNKDKRLAELNEKFSNMNNQMSKIEAKEEPVEENNIDTEEDYEDYKFSEPKVDNIKDEKEEDNYDYKLDDLEDESEDNYEDSIGDTEVIVDNIVEKINKNAELQEENESLREQNEVLQGENESVKEKLRVANRNIAKSEKKIQALEFKNSAQDTKIQSLESELEDKEEEFNKERAKYEAQLRDKDRSFDLIKRDYDKLKIENKKYQEAFSRLVESADAYDEPYQKVA